MRSLFSIALLLFARSAFQSPVQSTDYTGSIWICSNDAGYLINDAKMPIYELSDSNIIAMNTDPFISPLLLSANCEMYSKYSMKSSMIFILQTKSSSSQISLSTGSPYLSDLRKINSDYWIVTVSHYEQHTSEIDAEFLRLNVYRELLVFNSRDSINAHSDQSIALSMQLASSDSNNAQQRQIPTQTGSISKESYENTLLQLTGALPLSTAAVNSTFNDEYLTTRYTFAAKQHQLAADYIDSRFKQMGLDSEIIPFDIQTQLQFPSGQQINLNLNSSDTEQRKRVFNVAGRLKGTERPNEWIIIGAHFDSMSEKPLTLAPGAVDDGSGTAAVLTLAETLAAMGPQKRSVVFCLFAGEEQGLLGSKAFVEQLQRSDKLPFGERNVSIMAVFMMDMIAYSKRYFGVTIEGTTNRAIQELMKRTSDNFMRLGRAGFDVKSTNRSYGSDHVSFQRAGYPAILLIEADDTVYPNYHKSTDVVSAENVNYDQCMVIMTGLLNTAVEYAQTTTL